VRAYTSLNVREKYLGRVIDMIREYDHSKNMASEKELNGFGYNTTTTEDITGNIPYAITKDQKKIAVTHACSIVCPKYVDFISSAFFSKTHFNSHDWKQVNKSSILILCIIKTHLTNVSYCRLFFWIFKSTVYMVCLKRTQKDTFSFFS